MDGSIKGTEMKKFFAPADIKDIYRFLTIQAEAMAPMAFIFGLWFAHEANLFIAF